MIRLLGKIPTKVTLACSGGSDSMAVLDFLINGKKDVTVAHFNHGTDHGDEAFEFVESYCKAGDIKFISAEMPQESKRSGKSWEEWWRNSRYDFFNTIPGPIITAHHLNDSAEWWVFSSLNGMSKLIPYRNGKIIRPLLITPKSSLTRWSRTRGVPSVCDPGNKNLRYARSRIRCNIMPEALEINPGFLTVVKKKILEEFERNNGQDQEDLLF